MPGRYRSDTLEQRISIERLEQAVNIFGSFDSNIRLLEQEFHVTNFDMYDGHTLCIYDTSLDMGAVNKALVMHDVSVISSQLCNDTLEDYFKRITGGEGIA